MLQSLLYFNPVAGRRPISSQRLRTTLDLLLASGIQCEAVASHPRFEGPPQLDLQSKQLLIAMGGDGTIHELLLLAVKHRGTLGILPTGTANVLAGELGIPCQPDRATRVLRDGLRKRIALGRAGSEYFHLMAGIGVDGLVIQRTSSRLKRRLGKGAYWLAGIRTFLNIRLEPFVLEIENHRYQATFAVISNCHFYGGRLQITPQASPFSDRLEICLFEGRRRADFTRYVFGILTGRHLSFHDVKCFSARKVAVRAPASVPVQLDGDVASPTPHLFEIEENALEVIVPRKAS